MVDSTRYDVIIIGAGPAGCSAAYDLAANGLSVLLLDKEDFPRKKPCAGGFTMKAKLALRFPIDSLIQRECRTCTLGYLGQRTKTLGGKHPIVAMTERSEFDMLHLQKCREKGVQFIVVPTGLALSGEQGNWMVACGDERYSASYLIGADGARSMVRRTFGLFPKKEAGFAVETVIPMQNPDTFGMRFDFGVSGRGYAWIFPKRDHLNVGLYSMDKIPDAKRVLSDYCRKMVGDVTVGEVIGHPVPHNGHEFRHQPGGPLLVGDAAALVDPLMGEGLYNAIRSGQLAAEAVTHMSQGGSDRYDQLVREVTEDLRSYRRETLWFYNRLKWGFRAMTFPPIAYVLMKGYALGRPVSWLKRYALLIPFLKPRAGK